MTKQIQKEKLTALEAILTWVPQDGWTEQALENAAETAGKNINYYKILFPRGIDEIISLFIEECDKNMMSEYNKRIKNLTNPNTTERIKLALYCRLVGNKKYKEVISRTSSHFVQPWNTGNGLKTGWHTVDLIWKECGHDKSTDFNYYTKRSLLLGGYTAILHYWKSDESDDYEDTKDYIDRTIDTIVKVGGALGKVTKKFSN